MFPTLELGPLSLPTPELIILAAVWFGLWSSERLSTRHKVSANELYSLLVISLTAGVIGARLSFLLSSPRLLVKDPFSLISLNLDMFDPAAGVIIGAAGFLVYASKKQIRLLRALDSIVPFLGVLQLGFGLSHLASGQAYGAPTSLPWGIDLWGRIRHPSQLYEIIVGSLILLWIWTNKVKIPGTGFTIFLALSAGARLFLEAYRGDSQLLSSGLRIVQIYSWLLLAASLWALGHLRKNSKAVENDS